jgi:predicted HicB family RNase H-like nuclease
VNLKKSRLENKNAQKGDEKRSTFLNLRTTPGEKTAWKESASKEGLNLSDWVHEHLNNAAKKQDD